MNIIRSCLTHNQRRQMLAKKVVSPMQNNLVVSVSREYGSGGREIAEKLANRLGIPYYDKKLIKRIAQESGFADDVVEAFDEKPVDRFFLNPNRFLTGMDTNSPVATEVYKTEVTLLKKIADEGSCVVVGRRADSVLADKAGLVTLFICAPFSDRIERVMRRNNLTESEAKSRILKTDKARASYHDDFSNRSWGDARTYDLCLNSSTISINGTVEALAAYLKKLVDERDDISL